MLYKIRIEAQAAPMLTLGDRIKGEKRFGVLHYEPPYTLLSGMA
jgi:hypothetical protein